MAWHNDRVRETETIGGDSSSVSATSREVGCGAEVSLAGRAGWSEVVRAQARGWCLDYAFFCPVAACVLLGSTSQALVSGWCQDGAGGLQAPRVPTMGGGPAKQLDTGNLLAARGITRALLAGATMNQWIVALVCLPSLCSGPW